jgi:hypothetical protein
VLDIGGRNINGSCRDLFPNAEYTAVDQYDGPGVDIVADVAEWTPPRRYDVVIATEVFEHCEKWPLLVAAAFEATRDLFICTMAGPGRGEHSGIDGNALQQGEFYENIDPERLREVLEQVGFSQIEVDVQGLDVRAVAVNSG